MARAVLIKVMTSSPLELPEHPWARHLGDLARGETTWRVYLENAASRSAPKTPSPIGTISAPPSRMRSVASPVGVP